MLMPILKELFLWLYDMFLDLIGFCANSLLKVMSTDLTYFEANVPAIKTMYAVFVAVGWALLLGNMVFQAMKSMFSGLGFEGEDPRCFAGSDRYLWIFVGLFPTNMRYRYGDFQKSD